MSGFIVFYNAGEGLKFSKYNKQICLHKILYNFPFINDHNDKIGYDFRE